MHDTIRVDLHCHSSWSDGQSSPRELGEALSRGGVQVVAITDHDTVQGIVEFGKASRESGAIVVTGVELTTCFEGSPVHLLAYGFDPQHAELLAMLAALRQGRSREVQSIASSMRPASSSQEQVPPTFSFGDQVSLEEAIAVVHRAGGSVFLAHPLHCSRDYGELESFIRELKHKGLDGIEALYAPFSQEEQAALLDMAHRLGMIVCAGTDSHAKVGPFDSLSGVEMPVALWKAFRDRVLVGRPHVAEEKPIPGPRLTSDWRRFAVRFVLPTMLTLALFVGSFFFLYLPEFESALMDRKREMIRELTNVAWSNLDYYEKGVLAGRYTREQAQELAKESISNIHYGAEGRGYFWIQDLHPRILMHPHRPDLEGRDVSTLRDPRGQLLFVEIANLAREGRHGYFEYVWQWVDDPARLEPKESYIRGFEPWGWVIGTGMYVDDVRQETKMLEQNLLRTSAAIATVVLLLLGYVMRQTFALEQDRTAAERNLRLSHHRYQALVEAATEGTLLVSRGRCRFANPVFLQMTNQSPAELAMLDLNDLFPKVPDNDDAWVALNRLLQGQEVSYRFDAVMKLQGRAPVECNMSSSRLSDDNGDSFILVVREVSALYPSESKRTYMATVQEALEHIPVGVFRAKATGRAPVIACNGRARILLDVGVGEQISLEGLFDDHGAFETWMQALRENERAETRLRRTRQDGSRQVLLLWAEVIRNDRGRADVLDGMVQDVTQSEGKVEELEQTVQDLQSSLLFLHEPVARAMMPAVRCVLTTSVRRAAVQMGETSAGIVLVESDGGDVVGVITDQDLRDRALAENLPSDTPIHAVMSAPVLSIRSDAAVYEALAKMERSGVRHLVVLDASGKAVGVVNSQQLIQYRRYGPIVLTEAVARATDVDLVRIHAARTAEFAESLLKSGARPHQVCEMLASTCDAALERFVPFAQQELGPVPGPFAFLAIGSFGRREMTLASDQDNALIYADPPEDSRESCREYMLRLGERVCGNLELVGYPRCPGGYMASNPAYCLTLEQWKREFGRWIDSAEPNELLKFTTLFDLRLAFGDATLVRSLRDHIRHRLAHRPGFFPHFAQSCLQYRPPKRFWSRLMGEGLGVLDFKEVAVPVCSFARLYALREGLDASGTMERLERLAERDVVRTALVEDVRSGLDFLMRKRLLQQAEQIQAGLQPSNQLDTRRLSGSEQALLGQFIEQVEATQRRITADFHGGMSLG